MKKFLYIVIFGCFSFNAFTYEYDAYAKPIPFYNYINDMEATFTRAAKMNKWSLNKDEKGEFSTFISHKSYEINVAVHVKNNEVRLELISATRPSCAKKCTVDEDDVQGWLLRLRRSFAYEITLSVKDSALRESLALK